MDTVPKQNCLLPAFISPRFPGPSASILVTTFTELCRQPVLFVAEWLYHRQYFAGGRKLLFSPKHPDLMWGQPSTPLNGCWGLPSAGGPFGHGAHQLLPSGPQVKNEWSPTSSEAQLPPAVTYCSSCVFRGHVACAARLTSATVCQSGAWRRPISGHTPAPKGHLPSRL